MNLQNLLQEQKKEFRRKMLSCTHVHGFNSCILDNDKEPEYTLADNAEDFLTTAITKTWELALEEVEKVVKKKCTAKFIVINANSNTTKTMGVESIKIDELLTHIAHLKETNI